MFLKRSEKEKWEQNHRVPGMLNQRHYASVMKSTKMISKWHKEQAENIEKTGRLKANFPEEYI